MQKTGTRNLLPVLAVRAPTCCTCYHWLHPAKPQSSTLHTGDILCSSHEN